MARKYLFGDFTLDESRFLLKRGERLLRLEKLPMDLLLLLVERRGELVSREDIAERLWGNDVFLEVDNGINTAISKIRQALRDDPDKPHYIETVVGKGYRFAASVTCSNSDTSLQVGVPASMQVAHELAASPAESQRHSVSIWLSIGAAAVLVLLAGGAVGYRELRGKSAAQPSIKSIAVLPLKNLSADPSQEYLADGMTEELIERLSAIHDLRVISRTSAMSFKDTKLSVPEIAKTLNVDAVVEGSVVRDGNRIRVHAQLIRSATDEHLWSEQYNRDVKDVLALQSALAQTIAKNVEVTLTGTERTHLVAARRVSPEAYENNLKGRFIIDHRSNSWADVEQGIRYFQNAIEKDSSFAEAYVGLGYAYHALGSTMFGGNPREMHANAMGAAQKALALNPDLVDAHMLLAEVRQRQFQWAEAEAEYQRAIELGPNNPVAHFSYALFLAFHGRVDEAMVHAQRASELDPPIDKEEGSGMLLFTLHRYDEALSAYRNLLELRSDEANALWGMATVLLAKHQPDQAIPVLEKAASFSNRSPGIVGSLVMAYAQAGRRKDALHLLAELKQREQPGYSGAFVNAYLGLGDYNQVFVYLDRAYQEQANIIQSLKVNPFFDPVRGDPRFQDLLRRVGLTSQDSRVFLDFGITLPKESYWQA